MFAACGNSSSRIHAVGEASTVAKNTFGDKRSDPLRKKLGGLADVAGTLPIELARLGHEVTVIMPAYRCVHEAGIDIQATDIHFEAPVGNQLIQGSFLEAVLPESDVTIYFVKQDEFF